MTLPEFAEELGKNAGVILDKYGKISTIMIYQTLKKRDGFEKTLQKKYLQLEEHEFVNMARLPITIPELPILNALNEDPIFPQDLVISKITFYPDTDKGWVYFTGNLTGVYMFYYEK